MKHVCVLGASLSTGNLGVSALAAGAVTAAHEAMPQVTISFLDYGHSSETQYLEVEETSVAVELVNIRFSKKFWLRNNIARLLLTTSLLRLVPQRWRRRMLERSKWLKTIVKADLVGSIAGGDSFSDVYGLGRLLYVALPQILVLQMGKPLILLPQTLGPFKGLIARAIAHYILGRAALVCGRDRQSLAEAAQLMGKRPWKPRFACDMAFVMSPAAPTAELNSLIPERGDDVPLVGINVSGLLAIGGYTRKNMFGLKVQYEDLIEQIIESFVANENAFVLLVPHVFGTDPENDQTACRVIYERLKGSLGQRIRLIEGELNQHEIKYVIGRCDFFVSSRMHACIAALSQSVPAVSLAYTRKFAGVMESLGMEELVVDLRENDEGSALRRVRELFAERTRIHDELNGRMPNVKQCVYDVFREEQIHSEYSIRS